MFNTLRLRKNCCHFANDIFRYIFLNENVWILLKISLKFVPKFPVNYIPALVQIMDWHRTGNRPLLTHYSMGKVAVFLNRCVIFKLIIGNTVLGTHCEIALWWMQQHFTNERSTLVQVMAWCRQATSHFLSQCWPSSMSPYGITRPQWVNALCTCYIATGIVCNYKGNQSQDCRVPV